MTGLFPRILLVFLAANHAQAIYLDSQNDQSTHDVLRDFSFPGNVDLFFDADEHLINEKNHKSLGGLLLGRSRTQDRMLKLSVDHYVNKGREILWAPDVLWNLFVVREAVRFWPKKVEADDVNRVRDLFISWYLERGARQIKESLSPYVVLKPPILEILADIKENLYRLDNTQAAPLNASLSFRSYHKNLRRLASELSLELDDFEAEKSLLNQVLKLQVRARENNHAVLFREADIEPFSLTQTRNSGTIYAVDNLFGHELSINDEFRRFKQNLAQGQLQTDNLKFRYSIFSGCLDASTDCTYLRTKRRGFDKRLIYALKLNKHWLLLLGRHLFYLPKADMAYLIITGPKDGIVPQTKRVFFSEGSGISTNGSGKQAGVFIRNGKLVFLGAGGVKTDGNIEDNTPLEESKLEIKLYRYKPFSKFFITRDAQDKKLIKGLQAVIDLAELLATRMYMVAMLGQGSDRKFTRVIRGYQRRLRDELLFIINKP